MAKRRKTIHFVKAMINREEGHRFWVRMWLYLICLMVFAMVIVGGATRLTDSGLSITEWKPILGIIPPFTDTGWLQEFEKYKLIPEYQEINKGMSLAEFKFIYWWEWGHRFLGRIIGFVFIIPLVFFWVKGRLESKLKPRLLFLLFLGGLQGFVGWWMVSSGLVDRVDVSQYRLAVHLTLAAIIFAYAFWIARGLAIYSTQSNLPILLLVLAPLLCFGVLFQIFLGGLVAGLDAGLAYNTWPLMDGDFVPAGLDILQPWWLNWFENPKSVQFNHRIGAYILLAIIILQWLLTRSANIERPHKRRAFLILLIGVAQAVIGIVALLLQVPIYWALAHQAVAIILLAATVAHWRGFVGKYPPVTALEIRQ